MTETSESKLIHIGRIQPHSHDVVYLMLREAPDVGYVWYRENHDGSETNTGIKATNIPDALHLAYKTWSEVDFRPVNCGFRYDMEPRDEHGVNALFCEMVESYTVTNTNGAFFDEFSGHLCYVDFASDEALDLWHRLTKAERL